MFAAEAIVDVSYQERRYKIVYVPNEQSSLRFAVVRVVQQSTVGAQWECMTCAGAGSIFSMTVLCLCKASVHDA